MFHALMIASDANEGLPEAGLGYGPGSDQYQPKEVEDLSERQ